MKINSSATSTVKLNMQATSFNNCNKKEKGSLSIAGIYSQSTSLWCYLCSLSLEWRFVFFLISKYQNF